MRMQALLCAISVPLTHGETPLPQATAPKAAGTATLVYDIGEADIYYAEAVVEKSADGSFFMVCGWDNGYFGFQQYVGESQRSVVFAVWNGADDDAPGAGKATGGVQIIDWAQGGKTNVYGGDKLGAQYMRQVNWQVGETNRFVIDAVRSGNKTTYSAWLNRPGRDWEKLATFRGYSGKKWMRGYNSFVEDFRRDTKSATETRRMRIVNPWIHQFQGFWIGVSEATFVASASRYEAKEKVDVGEEGGAFYLSTGGDTVKHLKVGHHLEIPKPSSPMRPMAQPNLPFFDLKKPQP